MERVRLLIVDDDFLFTQMLPRLLQRSFSRPRFEIETASDPGQARDLSQRGSFDVILCDYDLRAPETGLDVLRSLAGLGMLRLLITGHAQRELPAGHEGAYDAFLDKPMTLREVVPAFAAVLRERLGVPVDVIEA